MQCANFLNFPLHSLWARRSAFPQIMNATQSVICPGLRGLRRLSQRHPSLRRNTSSLFTLLKSRPCLVGRILRMSRDVGFDLFGSCSSASASGSARPAGGRAGSLALPLLHGIGEANPKVGMSRDVAGNVPSGLVPLEHKFQEITGLKGRKSIGASQARPLHSLQSFETLLALWRKPKTSAPARQARWGRKRSLISVPASSK